MRYLWIVLLCCVLSAQKKVGFEDEPLRSALQKLETEFDVRYSYADSIVDAKRLSLTTKFYHLPEIHNAIAAQCEVQISAVDNRYYTIAPSLRPAMITEVEVVGFLSKGIRHRGDKIVITPQKIEELPGVTDADLLLALQQLPGIKSPNETASGLHIRGGTPDQNLVLVDGIRVCHPGHLFGMISPINPQLAKNVTLYNKATPAHFGERVSGIIDIRSDTGIADSITGSAGINLLHADAALRLPIVKQKMDLQLTARRSVSPWWTSPALRPLSEKVFQNTEFDNHGGNDFGFHDLSARIGFSGKTTKLSATGLLIDNTLDYHGSNLAGWNNQKMRIRNRGASLNWSEIVSGRLMQNISVHYSDYDFFHRDRDRFDGGFSGYLKENRAVHSGASIAYVYDVETWKMDVGYQLAGQDVSHRFDQEFPGFAVELGHRQLFAVTHAGFLESAWAKDRWDLKVGVRYSYFKHLETSRFEPRVFGRYKIVDALSVNASFETRSQIESQVRESATNDLSLENYVWTLSDGVNYPLIRSKQFSFGTTYERRGWTVNAEGYYKTLDGVTSMTAGLLSVDGRGFLRGDGFVRGAELLVQRGAPGWRIWASYNWQQAENRYEGLNGGRYFPVSADITNDFAVAAFRKWKSLSLAAGWNIRSGRPYSSLDNDQISYNDRRLVSYHRLNLSAAYEWSAESYKVRFGMSLLNVYNRQPVINAEYRRRLIDFQDIVGGSFDRYDYDALGFAPNLFVRIFF